MKTTLLYLFSVSLFFITTSSAFADGFVINLYYSTATKTLAFNNSTRNVLRDPNADTSIVEFSNDTTIGVYILKLYDEKGLEFSTSQFNKKDGAFSLTIPYFSLATQLKIIEKSTNKTLLVADLKEYTTCNGNGKCEPALGETPLNCMGDCKPVTPTQDEIGNTNIPPPLVDIPATAQNEIPTTNPESLSWWQKIVQFFKNLF